MGVELGVEIGALAVTSSSTLSQFKVHGEDNAKGSDQREPHREAGHTVKEENKINV